MSMRRKQKIVRIRRASGYEATWLLHSISLIIQDGKKADCLELCDMKRTVGTTAYPDEVVDELELPEPLSYDWKDEWNKGGMEERTQLLLRAMGR